MSYDLAFQLLDPSIQQENSNYRFSFVSPVVAVNGVQKLTNRWLKKFSTLKGTNPVDLADGTGFPGLFGSNLFDIGALQGQIVSFIEDCNDQILAIDQRSPLLTADERLQSADLLQFNVIDATSFEFWVSVKAVSGAILNVLVPYAES